MADQRSLTKVAHLLPLVANLLNKTSDELTGDDQTVFAAVKQLASQHGWTDSRGRPWKNGLVQQKTRLLMRAISTGPTSKVTTIAESSSSSTVYTTSSASPAVPVVQTNTLKRPAPLDRPATPDYPFSRDRHPLSYSKEEQLKIIRDRKHIDNSNISFHGWMQTTIDMIKDDKPLADESWLMCWRYFEGYDEKTISLNCQYVFGANQLVDFRKGTAISPETYVAIFHTFSFDFTLHFCTGRPR